MKSIASIALAMFCTVANAVPVKTLRFLEPVVIDISVLQNPPATANTYLMWHFLIGQASRGEILIHQGKVVESTRKAMALKNVDGCLIQISGANQTMLPSIQFSGDISVEQVTYENQLGEGKDTYFLSRLKLVFHQFTTPGLPNGSLMNLEINRMGKPIGYPRESGIEACFGKSAILL